MSSGEQAFPGMIGRSRPMVEVFDLTRRVANSSATVLLLGETGTGKELVAKAIHELSPRATGPFVRVNCGALSEGVLESELFGHVKGAFTNAYENRTGRFEAAHGGTIFLDEINSVSQNVQVKLLRVLQEHEFERVGDTKTISVDCRIIAATNRDLVGLVEQERFREDLYYRLNVLPVFLPPLRERPDDIGLLVSHFIERYAESNSRSISGISNDALGYLKAYSWPGNVRELQNVIERAVVLADRDRIGCEHLILNASDLRRQDIYSGKNLKDAVNIFKKHYIIRVLEKTGWKQTEASRILGIQRTYLSRLVKELNINR